MDFLGHKNNFPTPLLLQGINRPIEREMDGVAQYFGKEMPIYLMEDSDVCVGKIVIKDYIETDIYINPEFAYAGKFAITSRVTYNYGEYKSITQKLLRVKRKIKKLMFFYVEIQSVDQLEKF